MAATRIYKNTNGFCLMLELDAGGFLAEIEYPGLNIEGSNVRIEDFIRDENFIIPIADVRDSAGAAIGTQTEAEVRTYIDAEMAK
jgi:hypothetical protein